MPGILESLFGGAKAQQQGPADTSALDRLRSMFSGSSTAGKVSGKTHSDFMKYRESTTDDPPLEFEEWLKTQKGV